MRIRSLRRDDDRGSRFAHGLFSRRHAPHAEDGAERGRHRGGGRGRERLFDHGDLRFVVLQLVAEKPRHGYEIIKAIEDRVAGSYTPSPGVIYPTLTMLEDLGYITQTPTEAGKKQNAITPDGQAFLDANRPAVDAIFARIAALGHDRAGDAASIRDALHTLRHTLRDRLARGAITEAQRQRIAAILAAAAAEIENL